MVLVVKINNQNLQFKKSDSYIPKNTNKIFKKKIKKKSETCMH